MEKTQRETGRLDFPEVTVPVTPCWFLLACEISFSNHSLKAPRSLCWAWPEDVVAWLPPLVCKCVEVTREDWWLWGLECLALKPALYSQVLMTVFYQNQQMVILLYIECGTEEVLSFCWVLLTLGIFLHLLAGVFWISRILKRGKLRSVWLQYGIPVLLLVCRPR